MTNGLQPWQEVQGIYIHIPFCVQKCLYCDFVSYAGMDEQLMQDYADAVFREIGLRMADGRWRNMPVNKHATIYFGGGTPSLLPLRATARIAAALKEYGCWRQPAEATIEVNPGTADLARLKALHQMGFDRISFGVQSLVDSELRTIGRIHTAAEALAAVTMARQAGFSRINADVIYGLPGQMLASLQYTLEGLAAAGVDHLSVYGLIVEEGTPLQKLVDSGRLTLPDDDAAADMYEYVQCFTRKQGFERYEISNYAQAGQKSLHNLVYWQYHPYAAFGAAACGFDGQARYTAAADVNAYIAQAQTGNFVYDTEKLDAAEMLSEYMFMGLRKNSGADLCEAQMRFSVDVMEKYAGELKPFLERGLLIYDASGRRLRLTEQGMEVGNRIFEIFVTD